jgi:hypothetical protein
MSGKKSRGDNFLLYLTIIDGSVPPFDVAALFFDVRKAHLPEAYLIMPSR